MIFVKKEYREGLFLGNSIQIDNLSKKGMNIITRLFQMLAVLVGAWGCLSVFLENTNVPANILAIHLTILLSFSVTFTLCLIASYNAVKLFFCILFYVLFFISRFKAIANGFIIMWNEAAKRMFSYYSVNIGFFNVDTEPEIADFTLFVIMMAIPLVALMTVAAATGKFVKVTAVIMSLPIAASFLLGYTPSEQYLVPCLLSAVYLTRLGFTGNNTDDKKQKRRLHNINCRAGVWLTLISLVLFFGLKLFITEDSYSNFTKIREIRRDIQNKISSINLDDITDTFSNYRLPNFGSSFGSGLDGGVLGRTGKVKYDGSEELRVTAPYNTISNGVYLKGYVGSSYRGNRWAGHAVEEENEFKELLNNIPANYPMHQTIELVLNAYKAGIIPNLYLYEMKIEYTGANKRFLYAPYFTDYSEIEDIDYKQDLYAAPSKNKSSYTYKCYGLIDSMMMPEGSLARFQYFYYTTLFLNNYYEYEGLYREFVQKAYTDLPEDGLERLKELCRNAVSNENLYTVEAKISYIKNYLQTNTSYSLSPGKVPEGKDFVEYFLFENKVGYCAHYASAAALMLRAMGIPARYVEGYMVSPADIAVNSVSAVSFSDYNLNGDIEISIKDYNAHAWVEVYFDGIGWIPIEFTPASGIGYNAYSRQNTAEAPTPTVEPYQKPSLTPVPENIQNNSDNDSDTTDSELKKEANSPASDKAGISGMLLMILRAFLYLLPVLLIICLITMLILIKNIRFNRASNNYKAICLFARLEKIMNFACGKRFLNKIQLEDNEDFLKSSFDFLDSSDVDSFMDTVRKARYGRGYISGRELHQVKSFYDSFIEKISSRLPFIKKAFLKIILLLV